MTTSHQPPLVLYHSALRPTTPPTLLFLLPGNPGLIRYYTHFLSTLSLLLPHASILGATHTAHTVHDQVHLSQKLLLNFAQCEGKGARVVLVAHSMGAFVAMELLRLHKERNKGGYRVCGALNLFPVVCDIALSPRGVLLAPLLRSSVVHYFAFVLSFFLSLLPASFVQWLVFALTAQRGVTLETTTQLVQDPRTVGQALRLGRSEMDTIGRETWEERVWGGTVFLWADEDAWVAEATRARLLQTRRRGVREMVIDREGALTHSFCVHDGQSETVAHLCAGWVREIMSEVGEGKGKGKK